MSGLSQISWTTVLTSAVISAVITVVGTYINSYNNDKREAWQHHVSQIAQLASEFYQEYMLTDRAMVDAGNSINYITSWVHDHTILETRQLLIKNLINPPEAAEGIKNQMQRLAGFEDQLNIHGLNIHPLATQIKVLVTGKSKESEALINEIIKMEQFTTWASFDFQVAVYQHGDLNVIHEDVPIMEKTSDQFFQVIHNYLEQFQQFKK